MKKKSDFIKYEKLLIFGTENSGKSTLSYYLERNKFNEEKPTEEGKHFF